MMDSKRETSGKRPATGSRNDDLPFHIELWDGPKKDVERILARAATVTLARVMFAAARTEYPDRHVTLRQGAKFLAASDDS